jgi:hypothetical protein
VGKIVLKKRTRLWVLVGIPVLATVGIGAMVLPGLTSAATTDTAAASVDKDVALVGEPVTYTSVNPCTVNCALTWYRPDIGLTRFGGVIVGRGETMTLTFDAAGTYPVVLDLAEHCDGTTRLVCHSAALVYVTINDPAAPPVDPVPPADTTPPVVDPVPPVDTVPPVVDPVPPPVDTTPPVVDPVPPPVDTTPPVVDPVPPVDTPPADVPPPVVVPALVAPDDLTISLVASRIRLTWSDVTGTATSLTIERCRGAGCTSFRPIAFLDLTTVSFIESRSLRGGTEEYSYRLVVSDGTGTAYSNVASVVVRR